MTEQENHPREGQHSIALLLTAESGFSRGQILKSFACHPNELYHTRNRKRLKDVNIKFFHKDHSVVKSRIGYNFKLHRST